MTRYIKIVNNKPVNYSIDQLLEENPDAVIYKNSELPNEDLLKAYDVYPLITTPKPDKDVVQEGEPILINGEWNQTWISRDYTEEEKSKFNMDEIDDPTLAFGFPEKEIVEPEKHPFLVNKDLFVDKPTQDERYEICKNCDKFINLTKQCKECGCFMPLKTKLKFTSCPLQKW